MAKVGDQTHTAHGLGTITEVDTIRGRSTYRVAGRGFNVWLDETKIHVAAPSIREDYDALKDRYDGEMVGHESPFWDEEPPSDMHPEVLSPGNYSQPPFMSFIDLVPLVHRSTRPVKACSPTAR